MKQSGGRYSEPSGWKWKRAELAPCQGASVELRYCIVTYQYFSTGLSKKMDGI